MPSFQCVNGTMDYGTLVLWIMELWDYGTMGLWYYGLWDYGTIGLWYYGTMGLWYYGLWNYMLQQHKHIIKYIMSLNSIHEVMNLTL